jgi:hypothetical protein
MIPAISSNLCAEALRTIGHDLQLRGIKTFVIHCDTDLFVVEGGYQSPPAITAVTLHYGPGDLNQLNRSSRERNDHLSTANDFLSLSQILWAIGTYVNGGESRLLSVSNTDSTEMMVVIKIEYETAQGDRVVDSLKGSALYELCFNVYKLRGTSTLNNNARYTRFSALLESN